MCVCVCLGPYRQSPGGCSDGFSLWAVGGRVQAVGSLFGRGGVADLGEVPGRYRVHQRAGQTGAEELGLHSGGQQLHFVLSAGESRCRPACRRGDAFRHPHHFLEQTKFNRTPLTLSEAANLGC